MSHKSIFVITILVLFGVTACGKKGDVKPPQKAEFVSQNGEFFSQNAKLGA